MDGPSHDSTEVLLRRWTAGDEGAGALLYARVQQAIELRARALLQQVGRAQALDTASLVHEAWLKLFVPGSRLAPSDRDHLLRLTVRAMRSVIVDSARAQGRLKRGGAVRRVSLAEGLGAAQESQDLVLDLDEVLQRLRVLDERRHQVAELRIFGELGHDEIARLLGTSERTVERIWRSTRAWLERELELV